MKKIIIFPWFNWDSTILHREHMLANSFAKLDCEVYFIQRNFGLGLFSKPKVVTKDKIKIIYVKSLPYFSGRFKYIYSLNDFLLTRQLKKLNDFFVPDMVFYLTNPNWSRVVAGLNTSVKMVYDISDEYQLFAKNNYWKVNLERYELFLLNRADDIVITSEALKKLIPKGKKYYQVSNGVDTEMLRTAIPAIDKNENEVIAGFIGGIFDWVDLELIEKTAQKNPKITFVLIGPTNRVAEVSELQKLSNVKYYGEIEWDKVGSYFASLDIGLIPFVSEKEYPRLKTVDSNKIYQYAYFGYPIISTSFTQSENYRDILTVTKTADEFVAAVSSAVKNNTPQTVEKRKEFALSNSWEKKAEQILTVI